MSMRPNRDFINIQGRWVHYQSWGSGPVILALHGSPQSSRTMAFFGETMAKAGFQVIAPDTPGNGYSQPLANADTADSNHYAQALHEFTEALGLETFGLYGFHTGATIACTYAALYPERVAAILFDGLPAWSPEEDESLSGYLATFHPTWDGSHMAWLWARMEEQSVFFPWHQPAARFRMDYDVSSTARCHANAMELLHAGNHYAAPYRTALKFRPEAWLDQVQCDYWCTAQSDDVLKEHLRREALKEKPQRVFEGPEEMLDFAVDFFSARRQNMKAAAKSSTPSSVRVQRGCVVANERSLAWTLSGPDDFSSRTLLLLHPAGDSATYFQPLVNRLEHKRRMLTIDLPGHGMSKTTAPEDCEEPINSVEELAHTVAEACRAIGIEQYVPVGRGLGGQVAAAMLAQGYVNAAASIGAPVYTENERQEFASLPEVSLAPEWDGAHLLRAWRMARWERLFFPWYKRDRQHALSGPYALDDNEIHRRAVALLAAGRHGDAARRAEMTFDLVGTLPPGANFHIFSLPGDPLSTAERIGALHHAGELASPHQATWARLLENFGR